MHPFGLLWEHDKLAAYLLDATDTLLHLLGLRGLVAKLINKDLHVSYVPLLGRTLGAQLQQIVFALLEIG